MIRGLLITIALVGFIVGISYVLDNLFTWLSNLGISAPELILYTFIILVILVGGCVGYSNFGSWW